MFESSILCAIQVKNELERNFDLDVAQDLNSLVHYEHACEDTANPPSLSDFKRKIRTCSGTRTSDHQIFRFNFFSWNLIM